MNTSDLERIRTLATRFRGAIESFRAGELGVVLACFPQGCCGDATVLLGTYLREHGVGTFDYMLGERPILGESRIQSHAWLQRGSLIVDITADQFREITEPVIVTTSSTWHDHFEGEARHEADYRIYDAYSVATLQEIYVQIVRRVDGYI